jgi:hypothetical protein
VHWVQQVGQGAGVRWGMVGRRGRAGGEAGEGRRDETEQGVSSRGIVSQASCRSRRRGMVWHGVAWQGAAWIGAHCERSGWPHRVLCHGSRGIAEQRYSEGCVSPLSTLQGGPSARTTGLLGCCVVGIAYVWVADASTKPAMHWELDWDLTLFDVLGAS